MKKTPKPPRRAGRPATKRVFSDQQLTVVPDTDAVVEHPSHYTFGRYEVLDVIEDWKLGFHLANVVKYVARAGRKDASPLIDLKKARFYLDRQIEIIEKSNNP